MSAWGAKETVLGEMSSVVMSWGSMEDGGAVKVVDVLSSDSFEMGGTAVT